MTRKVQAALAGSNPRRSGLVACPHCGYGAVDADRAKVRSGRLAEKMRPRRWGEGDGGTVPREREARMTRALRGRSRPAACRPPDPPATGESPGASRGDGVRRMTPGESEGRTNGETVTAQRTSARDSAAVGAVLGRATLEVEGAS